MPLKIVRDDITKVKYVDAIVNTANSKVVVGVGCDSAIYNAAGFSELLNYRREKIGVVPTGNVFVTPSFNLGLKCIIHAVSPNYNSFNSEELLHKCYRNIFSAALSNGIKSIAIPLISSGSFGYPKDQALGVALYEINNFLLANEMQVFLVVYDKESTEVVKKIQDNLDSYIDDNYCGSSKEINYMPRTLFKREVYSEQMMEPCMYSMEPSKFPSKKRTNYLSDSIEKLTEALDDRLNHLSDTFSEYLLYLIKTSGMKNSEVYNRAGIDKKVFSKIKNNKDYHPKKMTAMCLCVGAKLNLDQTRDLLSRAGYCLSPSDKTDVIFQYFIENEIFDLIEIDIALEAHGLPYLIA